jgi:NodT family efflux transporter outer membrane factor (OMF) lipoprotein
MMARRTMGVAAILALAGCAVGPDYTRPTMQAPEAYKETGTWKAAEPADTVPRGKWWQAFGDPVLDGLMEKVAVSNQSLKAAEARYRQAQAAVISARAGFFPSVGVGASATRSRAANAPSITTYGASADLRWEIDLWGRVRRTVEAAQAGAQASQSDLDAVRLSLQASLAQNYFLLRVTDVQRDLYNDTVAAYSKSLELTKNRYDAGVAAKTEVVQAEAQLLQTRAQYLDLDTTRAQLEHAIAALIGLAPAQFDLPPAPLVAKLPPIPPGLPSALLERRPDIAAAERRVAAANAQIGVAKAAYFPALTLPGSIGFSSTAFSHLFEVPNRFWSIGPALGVTLLDFGVRSAAVDAAVGAWDESTANYRQAVLTGFQEVEDNLATLRILTEEAQVQDDAVRAARETLLLTTNQYKAGTANYLAVVVVQTQQLANERSAVILLGRRLTASVGLILALGGSY